METVQKYQHFLPSRKIQTTTLIWNSKTIEDQNLGWVISSWQLCSLLLPGEAAWVGDWDSTDSGDRTTVTSGDCSPNVLCTVNKASFPSWIVRVNLNETFSKGEGDRDIKHEGNHSLWAEDVLSSLGFRASVAPWEQTLSIHSRDLKWTLKCSEDEKQ